MSIVIKAITNIIRPSVQQIIEEEEEDVAFSLGQIPGYADGFVVKYDTTTRVIITAGNFESDGSLFNLAADTTFSPTGLTSASGLVIHGIFLDKSASSPTVPVFYNASISTGGAIMIKSLTKRGWYHNSGGIVDRLVGLFYKTEAAATIDYHDSIQIGNLIQFNSKSGSLMASAQNPDGSWQTPNNRDGSEECPENTIELQIEIENFDVSSGVTLAATSAESAAVNSNIQDGSFYNQIGLSGEANVVRAWIPLGPSRNIKIAGDASDFSALICVRTGVKYER